MYYLYYCSKPNISFITNGLIGKKKSYKALYVICTTTMKHESFVSIN